MLPLYLALLLTAAHALPTNVRYETAAVSGAKNFLRVYQTPNEEGSLTVWSTADAALQFYLFDAEGRLVYQNEVKGRGRQTVEGLLPGAYTYHAFRADEKLKGGAVAIKN